MIENRYPSSATGHIWDGLVLQKSSQETLEMEFKHVLETYKQDKSPQVLVCETGDQGIGFLASGTFVGQLSRDKLIPDSR